MMTYDEKFQQLLSQHQVQNISLLSEDWPTLRENLEVLNDNFIKHYTWSEEDEFTNVQVIMFFRYPNFLDTDTEEIKIKKVEDRFTITLNLFNIMINTIMYQ